VERGVVEDVGVLADPDLGLQLLLSGRERARALLHGDLRWAGRGDERGPLTISA
jgi:hypothetical protein